MEGNLIPGRLILVGRNISFYEKNNFGSYKSYHIVGRPSNFYGGYWHNDEMGFGRYSPYYEKLGKKVWVLGLSQEGTRWENLLGDNDGLNVELQSGRLFNQASRGSEFTPFKHVGFAPYAADAWSDSWFPVKQTRGMTNASLQGSFKPSPGRMAGSRLTGCRLRTSQILLKFLPQTPYYLKSI